MLKNTRFRPGAWLFIAVVSAFAVIVSAPSAYAKRAALIIGNDSYQNVAVLERAGSDAHGVSAALSDVGFDVVKGLNLSASETDEHLAAFVDAIKPGDEIFLFFAGHGVEIDGQNFLLPVDVETSSAALLKRQSINVARALNEMREKNPRILIAVVDACRDNPVPPETRNRSIGRSRGLGTIDVVEGSFVIFSASTNQTALDKLSDSDLDPNSVFTRYFLKWLKVPGIELPQLASLVRTDVHAAARNVGHDQRVAYQDEILGSYQLVQKQVQDEKLASLAPGTSLTDELVTLDPAVEADPVDIDDLSALLRDIAAEREPEYVTAETEALAPFLDGVTQSSLGKVREIGWDWKQTALKALGHYKLAIDGDAGPGTVKAVQAFQRSIEADPTGKLTRQQIVALMKMGAARSSDANLTLAATYLLGLGVERDEQAASNIIYALSDHKRSRSFESTLISVVNALAKKQRITDVALISNMLLKQRKKEVSYAKFAVDYFIASRNFKLAEESGKLLKNDKNRTFVFDVFLYAQHMANGRFADARDQLKRYLKSDYAVAEILSAWAYYGLGDTERALNLLAKAEANEKIGSGIQSAASQQIGLIHQLLGDQGAAIKALERSHRQSEGLSARTTYALAMAHARVGNKFAAQLVVRDHLDIAYPVSNSPLLSFIDGTRPDRWPMSAIVETAADGAAEALLRIGVEFFRGSGSRNLTTAQSLLQLSTMVRSDLYDADVTLAVTAAFKGQAKQALQAASRVPVHAPQHLSARVAAALGHMVLGDVERFNEIMISTIKDWPEGIQTQVLISNVLMGNRENTRAVEFLTKAIDSIERPARRDWVLYSQRGYASYDLGDKERGLADLERAYSLEHRNVDLTNGLAYLWLQEGINLEKAKGLALRAYAMRPTDAYIIDTLGWAHYRLGNYEEAVERLEEAITIEPSAVSMEHLGDALWQAGDRPQAGKIWSELMADYKLDQSAKDRVSRKIAIGLSTPPETY